MHVTLTSPVQAVPLRSTTEVVATYLRTHPTRLVAGQGSVRAQFQLRPPTERPALEFLLRDPARALWYVRWPNGSVRWESTAGLKVRGFSVPARPILEGIAEP